MLYFSAFLFSFFLERNEWLTISGVQYAIPPHALHSSTYRASS